MKFRARHGLGTMVLIATMLGSSGDATVFDKVSVQDVICGDGLATLKLTASLTSGSDATLVSDYADTLMVVTNANLAVIAALIEPDNGAVAAINAFAAGTDASGAITASVTIATLDASTLFFRVFANAEEEDAPIPVGKTVNLSLLKADYTAADGDVLTGSTRRSVTLPDNVTVTLKGVTITNVGDYANNIICKGNATLYLADGTQNTVSSTGSRSGAILAGGAGTTLTIRGNTGKLTARGGDYGSGIGASSQTSCGNIVIKGGVVDAMGGRFAAGIGACFGQTCGDITILGGTVTATGQQAGAGIGAGGTYSVCGNIFIRGGTVVAQGGLYAAGIGAGTTYSDCGDIWITGGSVTATSGGGENADYDVGRGSSGQCGLVTATVPVRTASGSAAVLYGQE